VDDNNKMDLTVRWDGMDSIHIAQYRSQCWALMNAVCMNFLDSVKGSEIVEWLSD
jgi:hypothetical protein